MPHATADDGVKLYYEETGAGVPLIFVHEFAGNLKSWEAQLRHFGQRYHAVAYNARGYPPSVDNFYNEPPFADRLAGLAAQNRIPESAQHDFVNAVVTCATGNPYGVSNAAMPPTLQ